jgi:chromosome segregation ATPase
MYAKHLNSTLRTKSEQLAEAECRQQAQEQELRKMLSQVQIGKKDKAELQKKLDALERTSRDAREVRVNVRDLMAGISPSIIGSLTNLCIAPPAGVAVPSFLLVSPSATSIEVKVPNPLV